MKKVISLRVPMHLYEKAKAQARVEGITLTTLILRGMTKETAKIPLK